MKGTEKTDHPLLSRLTNTSELRETIPPSCEMREGVWEWLVSNLPSAYSPKGKSTAEILQAFECLGQDTKGPFVTSVGKLQCMTCLQHSDVIANTGSVYDFEQWVNEKYPYDFQKVMEVVIRQSLQQQVQGSFCTTCHRPLEEVTAHISTSDFLIVNIGLVDGHNQQKPPVLVPEDMLIYGTQYSLSSAVQMSPGHFMAICKHQGNYMVLDGVSQDVLCYPTFAGAVHRDASMTKKADILRPWQGNGIKRGVHLLVYAKTGGITDSIIQFSAHDVETRLVMSGEQDASINCIVIPNDDINTSLNHKNEINTSLQHTVYNDNAVVEKEKMKSPQKRSFNDTSTESVYSKCKRTPLKELRSPDFNLNGPSGNETLLSGLSQRSQISTPNSYFQPPYNSTPVSSKRRNDTSQRFNITTQSNKENTPQQHMSTPKKKKDVSQICRTQLNLCSDGKENTASGENTNTLSEKSISVNNTSNGTAVLDTRRSFLSRIGIQLRKDVVDKQNVTICGQDVSFVTYENNIYLSCKETFRFLGMEKHITRRGYTKIDSILENDETIEGVFLMNARKRLWIQREAILFIIRHKSIQNKEMLAVFNVFVECVQNLSPNKTNLKNHVNGPGTKQNHYSLPGKKHNQSGCSKPEQQSQSDFIGLTEHYEKSSHIKQPDFSGPSQNSSLKQHSQSGSQKQHEQSCHGNKDKQNKALLEDPKKFLTEKGLEVSEDSTKGTLFEGKMPFGNLFIDCMISKEIVYIGTDDSFQFLGILNKKKREGFTVIDKHLERSGLDPDNCYMKRGNKRAYITVEAARALVISAPTKMISSEIKMSFTKNLVLFLQHITVSRCEEHRFRIIESGSNSEPDKHSPVDIIHDAIQVHFQGNRTDFLNALSDMISATRREKEKLLTQDEIVYVLQRAHDKSKKGAKAVMESITRLYKHLNPVTPEDIIHVRENSSGTKLMEDLRKLLPGVIPPRSEEIKTLGRISEEFLSVLLPRRTSTGWYIDPSRLVEVLLFRYPFLEEELHLRLQGDARKVGGRHSTYIGVTFVNNEIKLQGLSYQNPKEVYPITLFYESDSRDNLEENIGKNNFLERFLSNSPPNFHFYLAGDHMFVQAILDGSDKLGPLTERGWNLYHECDKEQKKEVAGESGLRTDLNLPIDRQHPESLLPSLPLTHIVPCILHGLTRCVEKLISLEVENMWSLSNKIAQVSGQVNFEDLVKNLEANINVRGVRQGNFRIPFDRNGKPEKLSLNKDHALTIISPPPPGHENQYCHVLSNVVPHTKVQNNIDSKVQKSLQLDGDLTEFGCVLMIWESLYILFKILQKEPSVTLGASGKEGSLRPFDYNWGYTEEQKETYKFHADRMYHLFCLRYTWRNLTPYMTKFIDHGLHFMTNLSIPMCRFSTEGGEHSNYYHNCFYYQHTTRHGGKSSFDPHLAIFSSMWKRLCYEVKNGGNQEAVLAFSDYVQRHVAARKIQKAYRLYAVRSKLKKTGWTEKAQTEEEKKRNRESLAELQMHMSQKVAEIEPKPVLSGKHFILSGSVPKYQSRKLTQKDVIDLIIRHGGKTRKNVPGSSKGRSTKKYIILVNTAKENFSGKIPSLVKEAVRRRYPIVDYSFLFDSIDNKEIQTLSKYMPSNISKITKTVTVQPSLHHQHFKKNSRMITLLKAPRQKMIKPEREMKVSKNVAVYYATIKRRELAKTEGFTFKKSGEMFGQFTKDFAKLPAEEKTKYHSMWKKERAEKHLQSKKLKELRLHNTIKMPQYSIISQVYEQKSENARDTLKTK